MSAQLIVRTGLGLVLLAATDVAAQTRKDVSVGYGFIEQGGDFEAQPHFPLGMYVSYAEGGVLKGVGDVSFHTTGRDGRDFLIMAQTGVRLGPQTRRVRPFVQALFGLAVYGGGASWTPQFGGGIDIPERADGSGHALRLGLDMPIFLVGANPKFIRATVGIVFSRLRR